MCPKFNSSTNQMITLSNSSIIDRLKLKFINVHRITIIAIILYMIFLIIFIIFNTFMCIWNIKINRKKYYMTSIINGFHF